ncbi:asparagine synthase (glutamine-hydrolyzing) [Lentzea nigeriaca]|nr:asparagine synthase (glutamine-hydrolyzing) [Lentzea nigeriaca]
MRTVAALQRHGGPDGHGNGRWAGCALGSNRLAVMDPAGEQQPYQLGDVKVVFNGEIYNHETLRRRLGMMGYTFPDRCDGSILPALYLEYGDSFPDHLDGMFAVVVLDLRHEPRMVIAIDHAGMKPLFYRWDGAERSLHFSSEIGSLLGFGAVSRDLWAPGLDAYLATKTPFGEQTMFTDIKVLPPAATAVCDQAGLRIRTRPGPAGRSEDVRTALSDEVQKLLIADVPVATITSGGLDSSLVTEFAAQVEPDLHTFNIAYRGTWPHDERHFARQVAVATRAAYHQVEIDPATFPQLLSDVVWHLGQPNADPITLSTYALFRAVREAGFTVALTGDAADELFGGYDRMRDAANGGQQWLPRYLDTLAVLPSAQRHALYTKEYAHELPSPLPVGAMEILGGPGSVLKRITEFELRYRLPAYHLRRVDHLSMASGVEVRLPFCQQRIVGIGRALPDEQRISGGNVKRALYAAARGLLPPDVLDRPKQPFTLPIVAMLRPGAALWEFARDMLAPSRLLPAGQVAPDRVQALFTRQAADPDPTTALTLWALLVYEVWSEQFSVGVPSLAEMAAA